MALDDRRRRGIDACIAPNGGVATSTMTVSGTVTATPSLTGSTNSDAVATTGAGTVVASQDFQMIFNGTTWDRSPGTTLGAYVQGSVANGSAIGSTNPVIVGGFDGTNARRIATDTSGNVKMIVGTGNLACNVAQMNGVAVSMGSGVNGTGVQRVSLATDQAALSVAGVFSVKVDQTTDGTTNKVRAVMQGGTTITPEQCGLSAAGVPRVAIATPTGSTIVNTGASTNAGFSKASAAQLFAVTAYNQSAAVRYVKLFNKASAPTVGTDVPIFVLAVPVNGHATFAWPTGLALGTGLAYCCVTGAALSDATATAANDVQFTISWI